MTYSVKIGEEANFVTTMIHCDGHYVFKKIWKRFKRINVLTKGVPVPNVRKWIVLRLQFDVDMNNVNTTKFNSLSPNVIFFSHSPILCVCGMICHLHIDIGAVKWWWSKRMSEWVNETKKKPLGLMRGWLHDFMAFLNELWVEKNNTQQQQQHQQPQLFIYIYIHLQTVTTTTKTHKSIGGRKRNVAQKQQNQFTMKNNDNQDRSGNTWKCMRNKTVPLPWQVPRRRYTKKCDANEKSFSCNRSNTPNFWCLLCLGFYFVCTQFESKKFDWHFSMIKSRESFRYAN